MSLQCADRGPPASYFLPSSEHSSARRTAVAKECGRGREWRVVAWQGIEHGVAGNSSRRARNMRGRE